MPLQAVQEQQQQQQGPAHSTTRAVVDADGNMKTYEQQAAGVKI